MRPGLWSFVLLVDSLMFMDHVLSWWASMRGLRCDVYAVSVEGVVCGGAWTICRACTYY